MAAGNPTNTSIDGSREARIGQALDEFLTRRARGEKVSEADLLAAHPDLADDLRDHLAMLRDIRPAGDPIKDLLAQSVLSPSADGRYAAELGSYKILECRGRGGMGIVFKAYEESLNRTVALKILRPDMVEDARAQARFEREAKAVAALRHQHIVTVYAVGRERGMPYLAMEYVDGPTLAQVIRDRGPQDAATARRWFGQLLEALSCAHQAGLIHRDVKSANILLDGPESRVKLADFGLARMLAAQTRMTLGPGALGTPEYMSPEQARGDADLDHRTDLYSAGVVLYEMLTGRTPFRADTPTATIHRILNEEPADPRTFLKGADRTLVSLALRLMAKRREDRFESAREAMSALGEARKIGLPARRRRFLGWAATAVLVLAVLLAGWRTLARAQSLTRVLVDPQAHERILACRGNDPIAKLFCEFPPSVHVRAVAMADRNGKGDRIVLAGLGAPWEKDPFFALDNAGNIIKRTDLSPDWQWPDCGPPTVWYVQQIIAADLDGVPGDEVVVTACDAMEYATRVSIFDARTRDIRSTFWHFGHLPGVLVKPNFFAPGRPAILAWGVNNKLDGFDDKQEPTDDTPVTPHDIVPVVMVLDPADPNGLGPPRSSRTDIPTAQVYAYAFLDVVPGQDDRQLVDGDNPASRPSLDELGYIGDVRPGNYSPRDANDPAMSVHITRDTLSGTGKTLTEELAILVLDRNLNLRHITKDSERGDNPRRHRWRPIIQNGKYLADQERSAGPSGDGRR